MALCGIGCYIRRLEGISARKLRASNCWTQQDRLIASVEGEVGVRNLYEETERGKCMIEKSAQEEWVRILAERPPDRDEEESRYVQAVGESGFMLLELVAAEDADLPPDDRLAVEADALNSVARRLTYNTLTQAAQDRLERTIAGIIADNEQRFINWYNNAQPIGLRKHQLDVLPDIGDKRREAIIDERRRVHSLISRISKCG